MKRLRLKEALSIEVDQKSLSGVTESKGGGSSKDGVYCTVAAIHAGVTKNSTVYPAERLRGDEKTGVASWTAPYEKPVLVHHNTRADAIGRVKSASYVDGSKPFIKLKLHVTDPDAAQKVRDGRYATVSIGAETDSATCSICGQDIVKDGFCGHWRGDTYEDEVCRWILGDLWFTEISFVNVPADQHAGIINPDLFTESANEHLVETLGDGTAALFVVHNSSIEEGKANESDKYKSTGEKGVVHVDELKELKEKVSELEGTVEKLKEESKNLSDNLDEATKEAEETAEILNSLKEENKELKNSNQELQNEKEQLLSAVEEKTQQLHESLAERVVDMRITLNKPVEESRDEEVAKYAQRSFESLRDAMSDLMLEYEARKDRLRDQVERVTNPGAAYEDGTEPGSVIEGTSFKEYADEKTILEKTEKALAGLFGGLKN